MQAYTKNNNVNNTYHSTNRIVSLVPSITELIYDFDIENKLVGISENCILPKYLRLEKANVGSIENIDINKIRELKPDIIFLEKNAILQEKIITLEEIAPIYVIDVNSLDQAKQNISDLGKLLNCRNSASKILLKIECQLEDLSKITKDLSIRKGGYFISESPWVVAGADTFINSMMELLNIKNVFSNLKGRFPTVKGANIHLANPHIILLPSIPFQFDDEHAIDISAHTHDAATFFVDGIVFSWYGSRIIKSLDYLKLLAVKLQEMT